MQILVNGNTINEIICEKVVKTREFRRSQILNCDFSMEDMALVDKLLEHIKKNKLMYARLVLMIALMLHFNMNFVFANDFAASLDSVGNQIMKMLIAFAKWGCIAMGVKNMSITMINGGDMKAAMREGTQYLLGFLFIQFYPQLFDMFKGIKF
ncbi:hypothetical protein [Paraclostridium sordellii]|uniref:hypothetical protein n=1 Tax=Paraclostridium sordellii TaxID=1505 RepID=UPI0005E51CCB|nr:hypothetical protein [Paeniclostridium sordellii]CEQ26749.1 Uncharacterised protein [[Clostridium] sordellii] [Paeniclostridium sordellii]